MEHNYLNLKIVLKNYLQRKEDFIEGLDSDFFYSLHYFNSLLLGIFIIIFFLLIQLYISYYDNSNY